MSDSKIATNSKPGKSDTQATPVRRSRMERFAPWLPREDFTLFPHQSGRWAKKVKSKIKLQIPAGGATPAPPVGSALGQHGVNIMDFCKKFNAETAKRKGETFPVVITVYVDKSFEFVTKTPPVSELIKKKIGLKKGSGKPGLDSAGTITWSDVEEVAKAKMVDLNAFDLEAAKKIVAGSARSMGLTVID